VDDVEQFVKYDFGKTYFSLLKQEVKYSFLRICILAKEKTKT